MAEPKLSEERLLNAMIELELGDQMYEYESKDVFIGGWIVKLVKDEDGHLAVFLKHEDGSEIIDCDADICSFNGETEIVEWGQRFTTAKIEKDYLDSEENR
jgi:hypothetical protein